MLGMKTIGTVVVAQAMQLMKSAGTKISSKSSTPDNCIIIKDEVLECRDSLTQVFVYQTGSQTLQHQNSANAINAKVVTSVNSFPTKLKIAIIHKIQSIIYCYDY
jgi:hypothetical protein